MTYRVTYTEPDGNYHQRDFKRKFDALRQLNRWALNIHFTEGAIENKLILTIEQY